jgi:hypothetical protein
METGWWMDRDSTAMVGGVPAAFAKLALDKRSGSHGARSRARAPPLREPTVRAVCLEKSKGEAMRQHRLSRAPDSPRLVPVPAS